MVEIIEISKVDFDLHNMITLFDENKANKCYAIILNGLVGYQFAWQSELLKPLLLKLDNEIYCIGIDQHFCILDFNKRDILLNINLMYNFYDILIFHDWIFVISELEIIKINKYNLDIVSEFGLPDYYEKMEFINNEIRVGCLNGNQIIL